MVSIARKRTSLPASGTEADVGGERIDIRHPPRRSSSGSSRSGRTFLLLGHHLFIAPALASLFGELGSVPCRAPRRVAGASRRSAAGGGRCRGRRPPRSAGAIVIQRCPPSRCCFASSSARLRSPLMPNDASAPSNKSRLAAEVRRDQARSGRAGRGGCRRSAPACRRASRIRSGTFSRAYSKGAK